MHRHLTITLAILFIFSCKKSNPNSVLQQNKNDNDFVELLSEKSDSKNVEIVFCLDATGSMSGLIKTAKEKIWDIISELTQDNDVDTLKIGMIIYRDRGDDFITKQITLTTDIDNLYSDLLKVKADGGGDSPESVNQALNEAVNEMMWSQNSKTYRTIFVVGDCPPHMDYQDDILYTTSCKKAAEKRITINTIKLGTECSEAIIHFRKMSKCTNGEFLQLDQNATDYTVLTPYDDKIYEVSKEIDESRLYYGNEEEQRINYVKKAKSMEVYDKISYSANSSRASYKNSKSGEKTSMGSKEIIKDYKKGIVQLDQIKEGELPNLLKGKTKEEKEEIIKELTLKRDSNTFKLKGLVKKRKEYIESIEKEKINSDSLSFSKEIIKIMKKQSKKIN